jgi:hypothetical protein
MARQPDGAHKLTPAERMKRYRAKQKAKLAELQNAARLGIGDADMKSLKAQIKTELIAAWEPEMKKALLAEQRKKGRELAIKTDQVFYNGKVAGFCNAAAFFIGKERLDIAQALLSHYEINREKAEAALQSDKRTRSTILEFLDESNVWGKSPPSIL